MLLLLIIIPIPIRHDNNVNSKQDMHALVIIFVAVLIFSAAT